ncbi:MAG: hypothetical protein MMC33_006719 [Icmadophila ericetorum]|nr:hypothetical protein [Icmadophila ericetorum]
MSVTMEQKRSLCDTCGTVFTTILQSSSDPNPESSEHDAEHLKRVEYIRSYVARLLPPSASIPERIKTPILPPLSCLSCRKAQLQADSAKQWAIVHQQQHDTFEQYEDAWDRMKGIQKELEEVEREIRAEVQARLGVPKIILVPPEPESEPKT